MDNNLKKLRKREKLTQSKIAGTLQLSTESIKKYEGKSQIPIEHALTLSRKYNVSLDWLYCQRDLVSEKEALSQTCIILRKIFRINHKEIHNDSDTVLQVNYWFRDFIASMNSLINSNSDNQQIEGKIYLNDLKDIFYKHKNDLIALFGASSFLLKDEVYPQGNVNADEFELDNEFLKLLGLVEINKSRGEEK